MAQDTSKAEASEDGDFLPEPPAPVVVEASDAVADGIEALQAQSLDGSEVSRQLEDLTGVVLSSAEVSTRSAEVAANISHEMREVMKIVTEANDRNILHSRVILIGLLAFLMIAVGTFFAISTRLQQNIRQLDALSLAVGKRVVELDATLATFGDATRGLGDTTEKLDGMEERQVKLDEKIEGRMDELNKLFNKLPDQIAGQVNGQSEKSLDAKLQNLQKSIQALEAKVQTLANKPAPVAPAPVVKDNQKEVIAEIQKLKKELDAANTAAKAERERQKQLEKQLEKQAAQPKPAPPPPPVKVDTKAEAAKAAAEAKAAADARAASDAKVAAEAKAAAAAAAKAAAEAAKAAAEAKAAAQPPALPPRAAPKEDRVVYPRPASDN